VNKTTTQFYIDTLPYGVVKDLMELIFDRRDELPKMMKNKEYINKLRSEGQLVNFFNFFCEDRTMMNFLALMVNFDEIAGEIFAEREAETEYWLNHCAKMTNETLKESYVIVQQDYEVHLPNGTSFIIYKGETFDIVGLYETDNDKFAVLVDKEYQLPFVVSISILSIHQNNE
jgi:hypothetical protein